jgi:integrase
MFVGKSKAKRANDRPYTHQEIHRLIEAASYRQKVLVLLMCSAGLRVGAIPSLNVGHLKKIDISSNDNQHIYEITVYANEPEQYKSYCTFECAQAIDSYLEYRKTRLGEIITDESPLVVNMADKEANHTNNVGAKITVVDIQQTIYRLSHSLNLYSFQARSSGRGPITLVFCLPPNFFLEVEIAISLLFL